jgi:amino acid adenylation domain-containing protein
MKALSLTQQRLWFLVQWEPATLAPALTSAIDLCGVLNRAALQASINALTQRHAALRTTVQLVEDQPFQRADDQMLVPLRVVDLCALPPAQRAAAAERLASAEVYGPFDLTRGPLVHTTLLALDAGAHVLLLSLHRLIADAESLQIAIRDLRDLYATFTAGAAPAGLAPLGHPIDFIDRQTEWLRGAAAAAQLAYWCRSLANLPVLDLPTDRPRPPTRSYRGARCILALDTRLHAALTQLGRAEDQALPTLLLSGFAALLSRYSGQTDIAIGLPISGREPADVGVIGCYENALVFRADLSGEPSFRALAGRVRATWLQAEAHRDLPFERLIAELQPEYDPSRAPIFQVTFAAEPGFSPAYTADRLTFRQRASVRATTEFDLALRAVEDERGLSMLAEYASDIFDGPTIMRLLKQLHILLAGAVATPEQRIGTLPLLLAAERQYLLAEWNDTVAEVRSTLAGSACLHELFAAHAARTPDAVAVAFDETKDERRKTKADDSDSSFGLRPSSPMQLTYRELDRRANQLAQHLRTLAVGPDVLVGICVERSIELMVAVLGVLKAGGAFVPLDPAYPAERLAFMLEDSRVAVLLTQAHLIEALPALRAKIVCLDADWPLIARKPAVSPAIALHPENLAYAIYTSGSTGRPKGVLVPHYGLSNMAEAQQQLFGITPGERVLQFASPSFDASIFEITMALCAGAALCFGAGDTLLPGAELLRLLHDQAIALVTLPPSALALLPRTNLPALRLVTVAGEACPSELVTQWAAGRRFFNLYGPTEATIWTTAAACSATEPTPPIGRPIRNTRVYLLDDRLQPVPIGAAGQVYIGGAGLARGYLNRPDLTAERFVPDPFATPEDERRTTNDEADVRPFVLRPSSFVRLYKTGDRARYRPDGAIDYLGRLDHQVKLRGFRIEIGEVEAALLAAGVLRECIVVAQDDPPLAGVQPDRRLVAYVVMTNDERRTTNDQESDPSVVLRPSSFVGELRAFLRSRLPAFMIPAAFVVLDALPRTPNGKVDRRALPAFAASEATRSTPPAPPRTPTEKVIAGIVANILRIKDIGIHDSFFDLGGHSLLATQVVSRVNRSFRLKLPIRSLFEAPSIAELASYMIANQSQPGQIEKTAQIIQRIKRMSAADIQASLQQARSDDE